MELLRNFKELSKKDVGLAGGKGASLGEMTQAGIPVPPGYVILSASFEKFIEETGLSAEIDAILDSVSHEEIHTVENASEKIQSLILSAEMPKDIKTEITASFKALGAKYVAVRSSATAEDSASAAWAGQLDSFLNTTDSKLLENVKRCWASLFTPRAIFYRFEKGLHKHKISVAVVVQKMVASEISGIAFSVHPVTQDRNQLIIEASYGLGEAIVSGQVTPDSYVVEKEPRRIIERTVQAKTRGLYRLAKGENEWQEIPEPKASKQALSDQQIEELSALILTIERHYGFPCDIEWAFEDDVFYIVQSRPITTLGPSPIPEEQKKSELPFIVVASDFNSPLVRNEIWVNLAYQWPKLFKLSQPDIAIISRNNSIDYCIDLGLWQKVRAELVAKIEKNPLELTSLIRKSELWGKEMNRFTATMLREDLTKWSGKRLVEFYRKFCALQSRQYAIGALLPLLDIGGVSYLENFLRTFLQPRLSATAATDAFTIFTNPTKNSFGLDQEEDLLKLWGRHRRNKKLVKLFNSNADIAVVIEGAKKDRSFWSDIKRHAKKHGWVYYVYQGPAFSEVEFVDFLRNYSRKNVDPTAVLRSMANERALLLKKKTALLKKLKPNRFEEQLLLATSEYVWAKPRRKDYQSHSYFHMESFYRDFARRMEISLQDARSATQDQIEKGLLGKKISAEVFRKQYEGHAVVCGEDRAVVYLMPSAPAAKFLEKIKKEDSASAGDASESLKGSVAYPGTARGVAKIVNTPEDIAKLKEGEILISVATTPSIVPAMKKAAAIVTDEGGLTCHAAIVSRELKIPCVVGIKIATKVIKDGDLVEVDANKGSVRILDRAGMGSDDTVLSKVFSREKTLFYFSMWNDSDRRGWKNFLNHEVRQNLFIIPAPGEKGSVWYSSKELADIDILLKEKLKNDPKFIGRLIKTLDSNWRILAPYLSDKKKIKSVREFENYYEHLVDWWSAMNTAFTIPDAKESSANTRRTFLKYRAESEKYTEKMNKVMVAFWNEQFPDIRDITFCIAPGEVMKLQGASRAKILKEIRLRRDGCIMLNGKIYPISQLESLLQKYDLTLEKIETEGTEQIKGTSAYKGLARGRVKKILSFADMKSFSAGDVLVTEMTNPDYVPIMKIAAAVVTDEGGTTCHAAIASRELKIPCIVGTKTATQILRDGDLVEVDANKGIVRIVELLHSQIENPSAIAPDIKKSDYVITFWAQGIGVLVTDITKDMYRALHPVYILHEGLYQQFFELKKFAEAGKEGVRFYSNKTAFRDYQRRVRKLIANLRAFYKKLARKKILTQQEAQIFLDFCVRLCREYTQMDFEYTDNAYALRKKNHTIARNLDAMAPFKDEVRAFLNDVLFGKQSYLQNIFSILGKQFKISPENLHGYIQPELIGLFSGERVQEGVLEARSKGFVVIHRGLNDRYFAGSDAEAIALRFKDEIRADQEIQGQIANPGSVSGRVKVISVDYSDFKKLNKVIADMQKGDVLVAETTAPELMVACRKASAIVTDIGGMMSHAAIVSRELKIPCIVGTKNASKILKDGDLVEVDASKGTVRVLESSDSGQVSDTTKYQKMFSRDFCLASVEAWVRGETTNPKGWTDQSQPFPPYIVTHRSNDTVHFYYDIRGVEWAQDLLVKLAWEDKNFLKKIEKEVLARIAYLQPIYEKEKILGRVELKKFIKEIEGGYPWFEAMWWFCQMDASKIKGLNITAIQKVRVRTDKLCNGSDTTIRKSLIKIYPKLRELVSVLSVEEIISGKIPAQKILEERDRGYFFGSNKLITGRSIADAEKEFKIKFASEEVSENVKEFRGEIAQKGIARGIVRKVMGHKQIDQLQQGEVLVSPMTMPDFLPAMKKAVAFITDEGGVTCHAAIVAREMKKPCITGTKTATRILHDGDLVEVDANKGIVKVLSGAVDAAQSANVEPVVKAIIDDFFRALGTEKIFSFRGPWSSLLLMVPWTTPRETFADQPITLLGINKGRDTIIAISEDRYKSYAKDVFAKYLSKKISIKTLEALFKKSDRTINGLYKKIDVDLKNSSEKALVSLVKSGASELTLLVSRTIYIETFDKEIALSVMSKEQAAVLQKIWDKATHPIFESFEVRRLKVLVNLFERESTPARRARKALYLYTDYFFPKEDTEIQAELRLFSKKREEHKDRIKKYTQELRTKTAAFDMWFKSLVSKQKYLAAYFQFVMEMRDVRKDPIAKSQAVIARAGGELVRRAGMPARYAYVLHSSEIMRGIAWLKNNKKEIEARVKGNVSITYPDGHVSFRATNFDEAVSYYESLAVEDHTGLKQLSGQSACAGKWKGTVRIVLDPSAVKKFNKGDVLVTSMTRPEFVPLMKKAGAVITNEGGITCHAAIVSRELNIPCVIGTKIATQVLKEGDVVEVDANIGIVTIL